MTTGCTDAETPQRDWREAHAILLKAFGADDDRAVELAKLLGL